MQINIKKINIITTHGFDKVCECLSDFLNCTPCSVFLGLAGLKGASLLVRYASESVNYSC